MNYRIWILISLVVGSCQLEGDDNGALSTSLSNTLECWKDVKISNSACYVIRNVGQKIYIGGDGYLNSSSFMPISKLYTLDFCGSKTNELNIIDDNETLGTTTILYTSHWSYYNDKFIIQKNHLKQ